MKNNLLKISKSTQKHNKHIKITIREKKAINTWYKKYKTQSLTDEVSNYPSFQKHILEKLLGYKYEKDFKFEYPLSGKHVEFMILKNGEPYIPIELKGTNTNLDKSSQGLSAVEQASNYASKKQSIEWYIVSNYYEFRLYNKKSQDQYIQFTIKDLQHDQEKLKEFLLIFSKKSTIETNILNQLYDDTGLFPEDFNLENEFYKLYNETRLMFIKELQKNNQINKDSAIEYAQLILNRYIFICFCEDKDLLPDSITSDEILTPIRRKVLAINTIWNRLNELFYFINNGNPDNDITGYNGGLFKEDLSHLKIRDKIEENSYNDVKVKWSFPEQEHIIDHELRHYPNINPIYRNLLIISSFDFNTDLTENILGHIFENSISDLEELKNEKQSKRKKEGVFYTPEHITNYICENTIIPYLSNENNNTIESLIKEYSNNLSELENKLKNIKILDPACGSGAFLNKATDTLLNIHKAIFKLKHTDSDNLDKEFDNIDNRRDILLNNIYGVDLNHESIEITKLGLFLKVCKKGIKLPDLDQNIRCGNSLIDNPEYTDKPFQWKTEFSEIISNGGFDIVIGNPPYVRQERIKEIKPYLKEEYGTYTGVADLYVYFFEKGINLLKNDGRLGFICSNKFTRANYGKPLRKYILEYNITNYNDYTGKKIFQDATVDPSIIIINKNKSNEDILINNDFYMEQDRLGEGSWSFESPEILNLKNKIMNKGTQIKNIKEININRGILTGFNEAFIIDNKTRDKLITKDPKNSEIIKPILRGRDIKKYNIDYQNLYLIATKNGIDVPKEYPSIYDYFLQYKDKLTKRYDQGNYWYNLRKCSYYEEFEKPKIIWSEMVSKPSFTIDFKHTYYVLNSSYILTISNEELELKYLVSLFNSKLLYWYIKQISYSLGSNGIRYINQYMQQLPIYIPNTDKQKQFINLATNIINKNKELHDEIDSFQKYLKSDFQVTKINKKLTKYYNLTFEDLYKEVKKQNKTITRKEKDKLEKEYTLSLEIIQPLQKEIKSIDNKIDQLVYELYDLTPEEIKIIEGKK